MKVSLELNPENYQIFQNFDDDEKMSLTKMLNAWISSRHLLNQQNREHISKPTIYRKAGSAKGLIQLSDDLMNL